MYYLLAICLAFSLLLIIHLVVSASASVIWRAISPATANLNARRREQLTFALRAFPAGSALLFVLAFLLPSYFLYEPYASGETVGASLGLISVVSVAGAVFALIRVYKTRRVTRQLTMGWLQNSHPIRVDGVDIPVYSLNHPFPVIAVVGMFRPRMFIASQIFDSLSDDEFRAAIAHEYGHLSSHDNLKRTILQVCRDLLIFPFGRELDRQWAMNTEAAADEYAANAGDEATALNLATALIKIARIVPGGVRPAMPAASYLIDERDGHLSHRVTRLLEISDNRSGSNTSPPNRSFRLQRLLIASLIAVVLLLASNKTLLLTIHYAYEDLVHLLR